MGAFLEILKIRQGSDPSFLQLICLGGPGLQFGRVHRHIRVQSIRCRVDGAGLSLRKVLWLRRGSVAVWHTKSFPKHPNRRANLVAESWGCTNWRRGLKATLLAGLPLRANRSFRGSPPLN